MREVCASWNKSNPRYRILAQRTIPAPQTRVIAIEPNARSVAVPVPKARVAAPSVEAGEDEPEGAAEELLLLLLPLALLEPELVPVEVGEAPPPLLLLLLLL